MTPKQLRDSANRPWDDPPSRLGLTDRQRAAWLMNASGLRNTEIAKSMGVTPTTVRAALEKADQRIAQSVRRHERWLYDRGDLPTLIDGLPLLPLRFNNIYSGGHPWQRHLRGGDRR